MKTKSIIIALVVVILVALGAWLIFRTPLPVDRDLIIDEETSEETSQELVALLSKAQDITSLKYDILVKSLEEDFSGQFWQKEDKFKMEITAEGEEISYIVDQGKGVAYMYLPAYNMATEMDIIQGEQVIREGSIQEQAQFLLDHNPVIVGSEVFDGKDCLVVEYAVNNEQVTMWIWEEHGLPIKTQSLFNGQTIEAEILNIDFTDISDDIFELPDGVEITDMPAF